MDTKMIGRKIAEARKKINTSQAELAKQLFISSQAVGKWERGESIPDMITCNRLAEIFGVDLNYFSENFQSVNTESSNYQMPSNSEVKQSVESFTKQPESIKENKPRWDMSNGNWVNADFSELKNLQEKFSSSNMKDCKFISSDLSGLMLKSNNIDSCDFSNSDISNSQIQSSNLVNNLFKNCSLQEAKFSGSNNIDSCDFSDSNISNSQIQSSHLASNLFKSCSLNETEFSGSYIMGCDFSGADFTGVTFKLGGFQNNSITNTIWNRTSFNSTHLIDLLFEGRLEDCSFENCNFKSVVFKNSTLTNTFFKCKSLKKIKFIDCQTDRITYEFLKNGKADLTGITLLTS